jgi:transaldolase
MPQVADRFPATDTRFAAGAISQLHNIGQSLWLDNITRDLLNSGTLASLIDQFSITGVTSNPAIFDEAFAHGMTYDADIRQRARAGESNEALFTGLALEDLCRAADLLRPVFAATDGLDGWVSMEVSPLLAGDTMETIKAAAKIFEQARRPNLFIKIPGTTAGLAAIEETIFAGIPVNVTLLFSCEQYLAAAGAYYRGIARRLGAGLHPQVASVASMFVSRWDNAVDHRLPAGMRHRLGIAVSARTYHAYLEVLNSRRWRELAARGARPQRLLWASTSVKDSGAPDTLYVEALAAPQTITTLPENTLRAFADHGQVGDLMAADGDEAETMLMRFRQSGIHLQNLAEHLQRDGVQSFVMSWRKLMLRIAAIRTPVSSFSRAGA